MGTPAIFCGVILGLLLIVPFESNASVVSSLLQKCYPVVGCFKITPPFISNMRPALPPQHPHSVSTYMYFHNRAAPPNGYTFNIFPSVELAGLNYDESLPTYVIVHGYTDSGLTPWILKLKDTILSKTDANIFVVDYSPGSNGLYSQAVGNAPVAGTLAAIVLMTTGLPVDNTHIIGHSLGAQVASIIAKKIFSSTGSKINRVTALDPAGPLFELHSDILHVNANDAERVVVLHTNAGLAGMIQPVGHIDFYFNGAVFQPGCDPTRDGDNNDFTSCSHQRAPKFFIEAVENEGCMRGKRATLLNVASGSLNSLLHSGAPNLLKPVKGDCTEETCPPVDLDTDEFNANSQGVYNVLTDAKPPYCIPVL